MMDRIIHLKIVASEDGRHCGADCPYTISHETHMRTVRRCVLFAGPTTFYRADGCIKAEKVPHDLAAIEKRRAEILAEVSR